MILKEKVRRFVSLPVSTHRDPSNGTILGLLFLPKGYGALSRQNGKFVCKSLNVAAESLSPRWPAHANFQHGPILVHDVFFSRVFSLFAAQNLPWWNSVSSLPHGRLDAAHGWWGRGKTSRRSSRKEEKKKKTARLGVDSHVLIFLPSLIRT